MKPPVQKHPARGIERPRRTCAPPQPLELEGMRIAATTDATRPDRAGGAVRAPLSFETTLWGGPARRSAFPEAPPPSLTFIGYVRDVALFDARARQQPAASRKELRPVEDTLAALRHGLLQGAATQLDTHQLLGLCIAIGSVFSTEQIASISSLLWPVVIRAVLRSYSPSAHANSVHAPTRAPIGMVAFAVATLGPAPAHSDDGHCCLEVLTSCVALFETVLRSVRAAVQRASARRDTLVSSSPSLRTYATVASPSYLHPSVFGPAPFWQDTGCSLLPSDDPACLLLCLPVLAEMASAQNPPSKEHTEAAVRCVLRGHEILAVARQLGLPMRRPDGSGNGLSPAAALWCSTLLLDVRITSQQMSILQTRLVHDLATSSTAIEPLIQVACHSMPSGTTSSGSVSIDFDRICESICLASGASLSSEEISALIPCALTIGGNWSPVWVLCSRLLDVLQENYEGLTSLPIHLASPDIQKIVNGVSTLHSVGYAVPHVFLKELSDFICCYCSWVQDGHLDHVKALIKLRCPDSSVMLNCLDALSSQGQTKEKILLPFVPGELTSLLRCLDVSSPWFAPILRNVMRACGRDVNLPISFYVYTLEHLVMVHSLESITAELRELQPHMSKVASRIVQRLTTEMDCLLESSPQCNFLDRVLKAATVFSLDLAAFFSAFHSRIGCLSEAKKSVHTVRLYCGVVNQYES